MEKHPVSAPTAPTTPQRPPISHSTQTTPQSQNAVSRMKADGSVIWSNEYNEVREDILNTQIIDLRLFSRIIFDLNLNATNFKPLGERIEAKLDGYLAVAENQREHEKTLYDPLNEFLNAIGQASGDLARVFYTQAYRRILGYGLDRRPDLSQISRIYLDLRDNEDLDSFLRESWMERMHWLLMLCFVEVKHKNGRTLGHGIRKRTVTKVAAKNAKTGNSTKTLPAPTSEKSSLSLGLSTSVSPSDSEDKASALFEKTRRQVAAYGKVLFSAGAIRSHVVGLVIDDTVCRFVFYCRSIVVESEPMDFETSPGKDWFVELVQHLHSLPPDKLGLIPNMEPSSSQHFKLRRIERNSKRSPEDREEPELQSKKVKIDGKGKQKEEKQKEEDSQGSSTHASTASFVFSNVQSPPSEYTSAEGTASGAVEESPSPALSLVGYTYTLVVEGFKRVLRVTQVIFRSDCLIGRGTTVFQVECIKEEVVETAQRTTVAPEESWKGEDLILKISFPPSERMKESELIDSARAHAKTHNAKWALQHLPRVVASVDSLDWESNDPNENTLQNRLKSQFGDAYEMRSLRATVLEKLEPLSNLKSAREFAQVFYDILQIHRWLYEQPKILHRDLSMANIMFRREGDQVYGVLNDFDLSSLLTRMDKSPTSKHRTGTKPFMARDLLASNWDKGHLYRHDLESLFYITLIVSCHYTGPTTRASTLLFEDWFNGVDQVVSSAKYTFISFEWPQPLVQTYFNGFTQWLLKIRQLLNQGYKSWPGPFFWSDKDRLKAALYDWETLDGNVTYLKIMEVMRFFDGEELVARWDGGGKSS
ncbi:hypothetical protein D9757_011041 [Collybiopsis confluens]|uniref:Protein kinase domain-containing protein n=1 Tax=Collybiopsis confluens TaxID=2823264 RepID=A0A8H5GJG1_9AGAR|nr:hypothetical protein D9757_011041 [Collybiopsis confluens]